MLISKRSASTLSTALLSHIADMSLSLRKKSLHNWPEYKQRLYLSYPGCLFEMRSFENFQRFCNWKKRNHFRYKPDFFYFACDCLKFHFVLILHTLYLFIYNCMFIFMFFIHTAKLIWLRWLYGYKQNFLRLINY